LAAQPAAYGPRIDSKLRTKYWNKAKELHKISKQMDLIVFEMKQKCGGEVSASPVDGEIVCVEKRPAVPPPPAPTGAK
jgi:hypothetical protein